MKQTTVVYTTEKPPQRIVIPHYWMAGANPPRDNGKRGKRRAKKASK